jgi:hypothetical protein
MTPMQALILREVERAGAHGITRERLEWILESYRNVRWLDPPKDPRLVVRVTINQINRAQVAAGKPRICDARADDRRYRIEPSYGVANYHHSTIAHLEDAAP